MDATNEVGRNRRETPHRGRRGLLGTSGALRTVRGAGTVVRVGRGMLQEPSAVNETPAGVGHQEQLPFRR